MNIGLSTQSELSNTVHTIVGVYTEHEARMLSERETLTNKLEGRRRVGREDDCVAWWSVEESQHRLTRLGRVLC